MKLLALPALLICFSVPALARGVGFSGRYGSRHTSNAEVIFYLALAGGMALLRGSQKAKIGRLGSDIASLGRTAGETKHTEDLLESLSASNPAMAPDWLREMIKPVFLKLQESWASGDYSPMRSMLTPHLYASHEARLADMRARGEVNRMDGVQVLNIAFAQLNYTQNPEDRAFTALITASARDYFTDTAGSFLRGDRAPSEFSEYWTFRLQGGSWLLDSIEQPGASSAADRDDVCWTPAEIVQTAFSAPAAQPAFGSLAAPAAGTVLPLSMAPVSPLPLEPIDPIAAIAPIAPIAPIAAIPPIAPVSPLPEARSEALYAPAPPPPPPGRELEPRSPEGRGWSRTGTELAAEAAFLTVYSAWEKNALDPLAEAELLPAMRGEMAAMMAACRAQGMSFRFEGLAVASAKVALVKSSPPAPEEEFVARITARAVKTLIRNGRVMHRDAAPTPFTEYWVFAKSGGRWKLKELLPRANGKIVLKQDDQETDSSPVQMEWYYKGGAAA